MSVLRFYFILFSVSHLLSQLFTCLLSGLCGVTCVIFGFSFVSINLFYYTFVVIYFFNVCAQPSCGWLTVTLLTETKSHSAHCELLHPKCKCKHYTYTIPVIFHCGNPQSTGPTGAKQASSMSVCVCVCVCAGSGPAPSSVPNTEPSRLLSGNRQAKSARSDLFCCRVPLGVCFSLNSPLPARCSAHSRFSLPPCRTRGKKETKNRPPVHARPQRHTYSCGPSSSPLHPSSEAPNYENPDSFTWRCLI